MRTIDKIITKVNCKFGAPMGRPNKGENPIKEPNMEAFKKQYSHVKDTYLFNTLYVANKRELNEKTPKVFDCFVPMNGAYDKGGAYWGLGRPLRVSYTKDLSYINFYRQ